MNRLHASMLSVALIAASAGAAQAVDIAVNGGLETGDFTGWVRFPNTPDDQSIVSPGFSGSSAAKIANISPGSASVLKNANIGIGIVNPGDTITIEFDAKGDFGPGGVAFAELFSELSGGGTSASVILGGGPLNGAASFDWKHFMFTGTAGPNVSGGLTVQFNAATGAFAGSTSTLWIDNLSVVVPEPASISLLLAPAAMLLRRSRR